LNDSTTDKSPQSADSSADESQDAAVSREGYRSAFMMSLFLQTVALLFSALLLDGGRLLRLCVVAALVYWLVAIRVMLRSQRQSTGNGMGLIKYGFPLAVVCVLIIRAGLAALVGIVAAT
jgi:hypothetical protein